MIFMFMSDKLKQLEIKKLLQEYNFLTTDDEYKKVVIEDNRNIFMDKVLIVRKELNKPFKIDISQSGTTNNNQIVEEEVINHASDSTKNKIKKVYRDIVKLTHPDKVNSTNYLELYHKATKASDKLNILELFQICVELNIPLEFDEEDINVLNFLIKQKKDELKKIESSFIWLWISAITDDEKNKIVTMFVEQN